MSTIKLLYKQQLVINITRMLILILFYFM